MDNWRQFAKKSALCIVSLCTFIFCVTTPLLSQDQDWKKESKAIGGALAALMKKNGEGTDQALKAELLQMRETDQGIRQRWTFAPADRKADLLAQMNQTDKDLTRRLEEIVAAKGWPTIHLVGLGASRAAALILFHSEDHEFQNKMVPQLQKLVDDHQIAGEEVACIADKILVAGGQPQRFGTQFDVLSGKVVISPVEDPGHLDQRRKKYLLEPMAEYKKVLSDMYHMPVE